MVDGSRDGSFEYLQQVAEREPRLKPILHRESVGQTLAQQAGVEAAIGEVIVLVDDDVVAHEGLVTGHARHHAEVRNLVVLGYMPTRIPPHARGSVFAVRLYAEEYERASQVWAEASDSVLRGLWMGTCRCGARTACGSGLATRTTARLPTHTTSTAISVFVASKAVFWVSAIALFVPTTS